MFLSDLLCRSSQSSIANGRARRGRLNQVFRLQSEQINASKACLRTRDARKGWSHNLSRVSVLRWWLTGFRHFRQTEPRFDGGKEWSLRKARVIFYHIVRAWPALLRQQIKRSRVESSWKDARFAQALFDRERNLSQRCHQQPVLSTCLFLNVQVTVRPNIYYVAILSLHCAVVRVRTCEGFFFYSFSSSTFPHW